MLVFTALAVTQAISFSSGISSVNSAVSASSTETVPIPFVRGPQPSTTLFDFPSFITPSTDDATTWGDSIHIDPGELHRVYFQNIDGLRNESDEMDLYVSSMAQLNVGTFCWADPGLDFSQSTVLQKLQRPLRSHFGAARRAFSSSALPKTSTPSSGYQPGGTFMASTGRWATRSTGKPLIDPSGLGRWSGLSYLGRGGKRIAIITAYRSPRQQPMGGFGFYDQQYALLLSQGVAKPNVRKRFITDMCIFVNGLQNDGFDILLSLDANETLGQEKTYGIEHLMAECSLIDLHGLGPAAPPATYKYGKDRKIDFMLGSCNLRDSVRRAGFLAYDDGVFSKHRGMFLDLDFQMLLGPVAKIVPPTGRRLNSEDQPSVDRYMEAFRQYADDHHLWRRVKELSTIAFSLPVSQCKACFDAIDRDVTRAMLHAERLSRRPSGKYAWSPKLREAGLRARYWHLRLRELENAGCCLRAPIAALSTRFQKLGLSLDDDLSQDIATVKPRWKTAIKELKKVRNLAYDHRAVHLMSTLAHYENLSGTSDNYDKEATKEKIKRIKRLLNTESMRKPFRSINASLTVSQSGGLSKLFVPVGVKNQKSCGAVLSTRWYRDARATHRNGEVR